MNNTEISTNIMEKGTSCRLDWDQATFLSWQYHILRISLEIWEYVITIFHILRTTTTENSLIQTSILPDRPKPPRIEIPPDTRKVFAIHSTLLLSHKVRAATQSKLCKLESCNRTTSLESCHRTASLESCNSTTRILGLWDTLYTLTFVSSDSNQNYAS